MPSWCKGATARSCLLFLVWCIVTLVAVTHHEPWRDEADNWLVARDRSVTEIWHLTKYVGQPWLWYLVQVPFAKLGYHWQQIIHWPIAAAAVAVVVFRSPFSLVTRALFAGSYFLLYEYSVIARGYSLTLLFLFLACSFSGKRTEPGFGRGASLGLLANATSFGLFFACAYQLWALVELVVALARRRATLTFHHALALLLGWSGTWIALLQLFPQPLDSQKGEVVPSLDVLRQAFADGVAPLGEPDVRLAVAAVWLLASLWLLRSSLFSIAFFATASAQLAYLFYAVHAGYLRHWGFFLVAALAARWIALVSRDTNELAALRAARARWLDGLALALTSVVLAMWCVRGAEQVVAEVRMPFSNAQNMAAFIRANNLQTRVIAAHKAEVAVAVLPWFPGKELWYPELERFGTHMTWDRELRFARTIRQPAAVRRVKRTFLRWDARRDGVLLLLSRPLLTPRADGYALLHAAAAPMCSVYGENLWLYAPIPPKPPPPKKRPKPAPAPATPR